MYELITFLITKQGLSITVCGMVLMNQVKWDCLSSDMKIHKLGDAASGAEPSNVNIADFVSCWPGVIRVVHYMIGKRGLSASVYM